MSTELAVRETFAPATIEATQVWVEEMDGAQPEFPSVTTPKGGSVTWEIEGEEPTRELQGIVIDNYEAHVAFLSAYDPSNPKAPDAYWIAGKCQYITDEARAAGITEVSVKDRSRVDNRLVLFLSRPGRMVPLRIVLSGASVRPWNAFKQNQIVDRGMRVTSVALSLTLESKKYPSGHSGSLIVPKILVPLDTEQAGAYYDQSEQMKQFTRYRDAPVAQSDTGYIAATSPVATVVHPPAEEFAPTQDRAFNPAVDDDSLPF